MKEFQAIMMQNQSLLTGLHTKTDTIMTDVKDIKKTVKETLSSLQNFFTSESPVPRYILLGPPLQSSTEKTLTNMISGSYLLKSPTAFLSVLCSRDLSVGVTFQIEEPRKWVKEYTPANLDFHSKCLKSYSPVRSWPPVYRSISPTRTCWKSSCPVLTML